MKILNTLSKLFKREKPGAEKSSPQDVEKPSMRDVAEFVLDDLKSGLLDGRYGLLVWDKACDDPGMKPDVVYVVAVMHGGSLTYRGITRKGGFVSVEITTDGAPGTATVYIVTRNALNEFLKQIEAGFGKKLEIKPKEISIIHIASPETLRHYYNIEFNACIPLPIHRKSAEKAINVVISEIEKRIKGFFVETTKPNSQAQTVA